MVFSQNAAARPPLLLSGSQSETDLKEAISCGGPSQPDARLKTSVLLSISSTADKFTGEQGPPVLGRQQYKENHI